MSEQQHYKGACTHCGGRIEFPAAAAGSAINCPHCGGSTQLLPPPPPTPVGGGMAKCACRHCHGRIEFPISAAGMAVACPHCGQQTVLATATTAAAPVAPPSVPPPPPPPPANPPKQTAAQVAMSAAWDEAEASGEMVRPTRQARKAGQSKLGKVLSAVTVLLVGAAAAGLLYKKKHSQPIQAKHSGKGLEVLSYTLEKAKEGGLVFVVGTLTNHAPAQYFTLRVEFDLFDKEGKKVGNTSDYVGNLGPTAAWTFKAMVLEENASEAKLVKMMGEADDSAKSKKDD